MVKNYSVMIKNNASKMALSCHSSAGCYKSPEIKTKDLLFEGVLCSSVVGMEHEDFILGDSFDLDLEY